MENNNDIGAVDPAWPSEPVLEKLRSGFERFTLTLRVR